MSPISMGQVHDMMRDMCRWIEWDRIVNDWCIRAGGCQNVPCTCHAKFLHPRDQPGEEVQLIRLTPRAQSQQRKSNALRAASRANGGVPSLKLIQGSAP